MNDEEMKLLQRIAAASERTNDLLMLLLAPEVAQQYKNQQAQKVAQQLAAQQAQNLRPR